jgi:Delta3-Delta2-enoyl-CoA isomerase
MSANKYTDIVIDIIGQIGIIKVSAQSIVSQVPRLTSQQFNRPKSLNAFGGNLMLDTIAALRELNEHPNTVFTVLTGEGRFFSAGADVRGLP